MSMPETFGSQVPDSSPQGSLIEISTDGQPLEEANPIPIDTCAYHDQVISLSSGQPSNNNSSILELTQKEFLVSQKIDSDDSTQFYDIKSAQTPPLTSARYPPVVSSSPVITQETHVPPLLSHSMGPSAQLTSFRMESPIKIDSTNTTPKKRNLLITQQSFSIPNLPLLSKHIGTPESDPSSSIYLTAHQPASPSPKVIKHTTTIPFNGQLHPETSSSPFRECSTKVIPQKRDVNEIPDSSDDEDVSIIEITRTLKKPKSVLQVPSSQYGSPFSSPLVSPSKDSQVPWNSRPASISPIKSTGSIKSPQKSSPQKSSPLKTLRSSPLEASIDEFQDENQDDELIHFTMDQLRQRIIHYGLKPSKSRHAMIQSIRQVAKFLSQDSMVQLSQSQNINHSQKIIRKDVFHAINESIKRSPALWEKIYSFQPVKSTELQQVMKNHDITISPDLFKEWCDYSSIAIIDESDKEK
jgi:hypothetical protein